MKAKRTLPKLERSEMLQASLEVLMETQPSLAHTFLNRLFALLNWTLTEFTISSQVSTPPLPQLINKSFQYRESWGGMQSLSETTRLEVRSAHCVFGLTHCWVVQELGDTAPFVNSAESGLKRRCIVMLELSATLARVLEFLTSKLPDLFLSGPPLNLSRYKFFLPKLQS